MTFEKHPTGTGIFELRVRACSVQVQLSICRIRRQWQGLGLAGRGNARVSPSQAENYVTVTASIVLQVPYICQVMMHDV